MRGWMYILRCADGSYYTGSTKYLELRLAQHQAGEGANHTRKRLPVELVYCEEYDHIADAFYREKQVQGWSRKKKEALIRGDYDLLPLYARAYRDIREVASGASATSEGGAATSLVEEVASGASATSEGGAATLVEEVASGASATSESAAEESQSVAEESQSVAEVSQSVAEVLEATDCETSTLHPYTQKSNPQKPQ